MLYDTIDLHPARCHRLLSGPFRRPQRRRASERRRYNSGGTLGAWTGRTFEELREIEQWCEFNLVRSCSRFLLAS
jgi:hypothetical protein